jgi:hypothetical protein
MRDDIVGPKMKYQHSNVADRYFQNNYTNSIGEGSYGRAGNQDWLVTHVEWKSNER